MIVMLRPLQLHTHAGTLLRWAPLFCEMPSNRTLTRGVNGCSRSKELRYGGGGPEARSLVERRPPCAQHDSESGGETQNLWCVCVRWGQSSACVRALARHRRVGYSVPLQEKLEARHVAVPGCPMEGGPASII